MRRPGRPSRTARSGRDAGGPRRPAKQNRSAARRWLASVADRPTRAFPPSRPPSGGRGDYWNRAELGKGALERAPATVMKAVDRALGLFDVPRDLHRREADDVAEHEHLALVLGRDSSAILMSLPISPPSWVDASRRADFLGRDHPLGAEVIGARRCAPPAGSRRRRERSAPGIS